jgi:hypothetical protein
MYLWDSADRNKKPVWPQIELHSSKNKQFPAILLVYAVVDLQIPMTLRFRG